MNWFSRNYFRGGIKRWEKENYICMNLEQKCDVCADGFNGNHVLSINTNVNEGRSTRRSLSPTKD